jgi:LmbE family N-acetylglucosaminyl deacetylase
MLELTLPVGNAPFHVLCVGAHCDDIEIGCGGTLLALLAKHSSLHVSWVALSSAPERELEIRSSARRFLEGSAEQRVLTFSFRDGFFPGHFNEIKETFESLKKLDRPDLVFTHHRADLHQDHRVVSELTWNTFRSHLILEYEVPKYDGGLTTPSVYIALTAQQVERKIDILEECYGSQAKKHWFTRDTFRALLRLRGLESGSPTGWAEGFHAPKVLVG